MKLVYPAVFKSYEDNSGGYVVEFPDLPGCVTGGDNMAEAIFMAVDAASVWMLTKLEEGHKAPKASDFVEIKIEAGQFVNFIAVDMDSYAAKYGNKAVKKTLTIPAYLNTYAEENSISCSAVLREALSKMAQSSV